LITGKNKKTNHISGLAKIEAKNLLYSTPTVFGMISEKNRIVRVKTIEKYNSLSSPKTDTAAAPAMDAPAVLAMVFNVKIAVIGRSILDFKRNNTSPLNFPLLLKLSI